MKTVLDFQRADAPWLVKLTAGLPGGIGNCGNECGGVTAPLVLLGLRHARDPDAAGVPVVVEKGRALLQAFHARHGSIHCRDILGDARLPLRCVGVVRLAPERYLDVDSRDCAGALVGPGREACALLQAHCAGRGFHCAHAVLERARDGEAVDPALLDATAAFTGGTAWAGLTCSALVAGVMLLGLSFGGIEDSRRRVLRMIGTMAVRGDAFADDLNAFNRAMNLGHQLGRWFERRYGSTQCRDVTGCDFSTPDGARAWVKNGGAARCEAIAGEVALRVRAMVERRAPA
jgi:hypothetical protein